MPLPRRRERRLPANRELFNTKTQRGTTKAERNWGFIAGSSPNSALPDGTEALAAEIVDSAYRVHTTLGPGLLESVYEICMCQEFTRRSVAFKTQVALPITYDGVRLESALRLDLLVGECVIVELKSVEQMHPLYEAQLLSYLRLSGLRHGFLINFNVPLIKQGIQRIII